MIMIWSADPGWALFYSREPAACVSIAYMLMNTVVLLLRRRTTDQFDCEMCQTILLQQIWFAASNKSTQITGHHGVVTRVAFSLSIHQWATRGRRRRWRNDPLPDRDNNVIYYTSIRRMQNDSDRRRLNNVVVCSRCYIYLLSCHLTFIVFRSRKKGARNWGATAGGTRPHCPIL